MGRGVRAESIACLAANRIDGLDHVRRGRCHSAGLDWHSPVIAVPLLAALVAG